MPCQQRLCVDVFLVGWLVGCLQVGCGLLLPLSKLPLLVVFLMMVAMVLLLYAAGGHAHGAF